MNEMVFSSIDLVTASTVISFVGGAELFDPFWWVDNPVVFSQNNPRTSPHTTSPHTLSVKCYHLAYLECISGWI